MKKILGIILLFFTSYITIFAHPLDISSSVLSFNKNYLDVTTYFHSYEIEYLLKSKNINIKSIYEYYDHLDIIKDYIKEKISLNIKDNKCIIENIDILQMEEYQILSNWIEINYKFKCEQNITSWVLLVDFFTNFPLQTNQITFYDLNKNNYPFGKTVLTSSVKTYSFDLDNTWNTCTVDSDWDGISDQDELIYKTKNDLIDTDGDFYTDYEEIFNSWPALDNKLWPNQTPRYEIPKDILELILKNKKTKSDCDKIISQNIKEKNNLNQLSNWFWNNYFKNTLKTISDFASKKGNINIFYVILIVVWLWFVHAMWPGHSKSLLISYIIDKKHNFFEWFIYIIIFSVTHILDIILLFLFTKILFWIVDISNYMLYIQRFSVIILVFFSIFLIAKSLKNKNTVENKCKKDFKSAIFLWFVTGLAPCTFGWSIFLLLFSLWSFSLILPLILALGFWIFLCLLTILILVFFLREKMFTKLNIFTKYSSFISSLILFILSLYLVFNIF